MLLNKRKVKLRAILRETLEEQLSCGTEAVDLNGTRARLSGPWSTFFEGRAAWDCASALSRSLYSDLKDRFNDNTVREVLLAAADVKVSRCTLTEEKLELLHAASERHGFQIVTSQARWILRADQGKGHWANRQRNSVTLCLTCWRTPAVLRRTIGNSITLRNTSESRCFVSFRAHSAVQKPPLLQSELSACWLTVILRGREDSWSCNRPMFSTRNIMGCISSKPLFATVASTTRRETCSPARAPHWPNSFTRQTAWKSMASMPCRYIAVRRKLGNWQGKKPACAFFVS
jgi:hypothetical protein